MEAALGAIEIVERIASIVQLVVDIHQGIKRNRKLCGRLIERLQALYEVLKQPNHRKALKEENASACLKRLLEVSEEAQKYVEKFENKTTFGEDIERRLSDAVVDLNALCLSQLVTTLLSNDEVQNLLLDKETGAMVMMKEDENLQMITWLDSHPENNNVFIKAASNENKNLLFIQRKSCQEVFTDMLANRDLSTDKCASWRWRLICNASHGEDGKDTYETLIQQLLAQDIQVPVMVYTSKTKADTVRKCLASNENISCHPNTCATSVEKHMNKYCRFATLLWIGDSYGDKIRNTIREIQHNGVVVAHHVVFEDDEEDVDALEWAEDVLVKTHKTIKNQESSIRILVNIESDEDEDEIEEKLDLIKKIRGTWSWKNKVMFYCDDKALLSKHVKDLIKIDGITATDKLSDVVKYGSIPKPKPTVEAPEGTLKITKITGKNLIVCDRRSSDPYITFEQNKVVIPGDKTKTKYKKSTLNPKWNKLNLEIPCKSDATITIVCWDWNRFGKGIFMGEASIVLSSDVVLKQSGGPVECTFKLSDPNKRAKKRKPIKSGELTVTMQWIKK